MQAVVECKMENIVQGFILRGRRGVPIFYLNCQKETLQKGRTLTIYKLYLLQVSFFRMGHNCGQLVVTQHAKVFNAHRHSLMDPGCSLVDDTLTLSSPVSYHWSYTQQLLFNWQYIQVVVDKNIWIFYKTIVPPTKWFITEPKCSVLLGFRVLLQNLERLNSKHCL